MARAFETDANVSYPGEHAAFGDLQAHSLGAEFVQNEPCDQFGKTLEQPTPSRGEKAANRIDHRAVVNGVGEFIRLPCPTVEQFDFEVQQKRDRLYSFVFVNTDDCFCGKTANEDDHRRGNHRTLPPRGSTVAPASTVRSVGDADRRRLSRTLTCVTGVLLRDAGAFLRDRDMSRASGSP